MTVDIAVTTTADRFHRWAAPLTERRLHPVSLPCLSIRPLPEAGEGRRLAAAVDWLVITSPRVVQVLWPRGGMPAVPVAAVGEATAEAVRDAQGTPEVVGDGDGDRLVDLIGPVLEGSRVFIPHGARADTRRFRRIASRCGELRTLAVYDTTPVAPGPGSVDGAVFGSPSAVDGWTRSRSLEGLVVGAIGRVTAATLRRHGVKPVVADHPTPERLAAALSDHLERIP